MAAPWIPFPKQKMNWIGRPKGEVEEGLGGEDGGEAVIGM